MKRIATYILLQLFLCVTLVAPQQAAANMLSMRVMSHAVAALTPITQIGYSTGSASATSNTISHTVGAGNNRVLTVAIGEASTDTITSVTYGGTALTKLGVITFGYGPSSIYYMLAPPVGTANIVVSKSTVHAATAYIVTYSNVSQVPPGLSSNSGTSGTPGVTANVAVIGSAITGLIWPSNSITGMGAGTAGTSSSTSYSVESSPLSIASTGNKTLSITTASGTFSAIAALLAPA